MVRYKTEEEKNKEMRIYLEKLEKDALENQVKAKKEAFKALYETGVIYKDGNIKEKIVIDSHL